MPEGATQTASWTAPVSPLLTSLGGIPLTKQPSQPYAVAWDLDGVLVDSGEAHRAAWQALGRELGRPLTDADFTRTFGLANPDIFRYSGNATDPADDRRLGRPQRGPVPRAGA